MPSSSIETLSERLEEVINQVAALEEVLLQLSEENDALMLVNEKAVALLQRYGSPSQLVSYKEAEAFLKELGDRDEE